MGGEATPRSQSLSQPPPPQPPPPPTAASSSQSTPTDSKCNPSGDAKELPALKAPKDKNCPFCGQAFTSSSLGRHLDLYIRAKNPKPPDGVHVVDEIRKIRGGITRRQAKGSLKKEGSASTPAKKHSLAEDTSPTIVQSPDGDDDTLDIEKQRFKDVSWGGPAGSGSLRGSVSGALGAKTPEVRRDVSRALQKADLDARHRVTEDAETARATEMALRELLKSVKEANAKASGHHIFDFDPYTLNFPSLCLHILPPPSTLFSPTPFPTTESWSISPPGQKQLDALNRAVREKLLAHQRQRQINQVYPSTTGGGGSGTSSVADSPLPTPPLWDPDPQKLFCHIADAFQHWMCQTEKTRSEYWQVEILRSYARANDLRREAEMQLENARREIEYLKANRWTSGAPELVSPISINLGTETVKELGKHGMDYRNWDYDRIIEKWKTVVRETKNGMAGQRPLPNASTRSCSMASLPTQAFTSINGPSSGLGHNVKVETLPYSAGTTTNGTEPSSDQVDAEGEDDDGDVDLDHDVASDEDPLSNHNSHSSQHQHHGLPLQPTPIHPSQTQQMHHLQTQPQFQPQPQPQNQFQAQQAQAQTQAQNQFQVQAQAQAQAWAAARQHMNQSRNQHHHPHQHQHTHQHQQLSPHPQHMGSAASSRRPSAVLMDHSMSAGGMNTSGMNTGSMNTGMGLPMEGIEGHQEQFLRMDMGLATGFVGSNDGGV